MEVVVHHGRKAVAFQREVLLVRIQVAASSGVASLVVAFQEVEAYHDRTYLRCVLTVQRQQLDKRLCVNVFSVFLPVPFFNLIGALSLFSS